MLPFGGTRFLYPIGLQHLTGQSINPEEHRRRNVRPPVTTDQALRAARPKAVLALDCCPMCHSLPPGSPKRFQNRTGFIAGTAVSVQSRQQPVGTESPSEELSVAGPSCSCRRSYIPAAVTPFPVPLPLLPPLKSLPSSPSLYLQALSVLLSPIEKSYPKPLPAIPLTINNLLKPRAAKGEHAVLISH